jgi:hypothetical protein
MMMPSETVAEVERETFRLLAHYTRCIDAKDWAGLSDVFAADCVKQRLGLDGLSGETAVSGGQAIIRDIAAGLGGCGATQHLLGNYVLSSFDGDNAESRTYVRAFHRGAGQKRDLWLEVMGEYIVGWKRLPEGWRVARWALRIVDSLGDPRAVSSAP